MIQNKRSRKFPSAPPSGAPRTLETSPVNFILMSWAIMGGRNSVFHYALGFIAAEITKKVSVGTVAGL